MVKSRFTGDDVAAIVKNLRASILGLRVSNVYDVNPKTYILKLVQPDKKQLLLIESGIRVHTTQYARDKANIPSVFTLKLRKHIRTKRVEQVEQLGSDRVIILTFGTGQHIQHLIIELYASGNVILTDSKFEVMTLLRTHKYEQDVLVATHQIYPFSTAKTFQRIQGESLRKRLLQIGTNDPTTPIETQNDQTTEVATTDTPSKKDQKKDTSLKQFLIKETELGTALIEHAILEMNWDLKLDISELPAKGEQQIQHLVDVLIQAEGLIDKDSTQQPKGYITFNDPEAKNKAKAEKKQQKQQKEKGKGKEADNNNNNNKNKKGKKKSKQGEESDKAEETPKVVKNPEEEAKTEKPDEQLLDMYDEFLPLLYNQYKMRRYQEFPSFDASVDEFFSKIETQRQQLQIKQQEQSVLKKLDKVKQDQQRRVDELQKTEDETNRKAQLIEINLEEVDQAIAIIRSALATGMDWIDLARLVKEEKKKGNYIASMIHKLHLDRGEIQLLLTNKLEDQEESEMTKPAEVVDIDVSVTAYANARNQYEMRKKAAQKAQKTIDAAESAIKAAEKKTRSQLKEVQIKSTIQHIRKPLWFEKFHWFISSDNFLVLCGRDAQQNEQLYKRYLGKTDIYVHADLNGAATCIVKNPNPELPPAATLWQAGCMSVCHSGAWNEKIVTSAYWVNSDQVSKTAPSGEYLTTGSFMIRGKKNYLPPAQLQMGFAYMFKLHEDSVSKHKGERTKGPGSLSSSTDELGRPQFDDDNDDQDDESEEDEEEDGKSQQQTIPKSSQNIIPSSTTESASLASSTESLRAFGFGINQTSAEEQQDDDQDEQESQLQAKKSKPRISTKEKKQQKKGAAKTPEQSEQSQEQEDDTEETTNQSNKKPKQQPLPRGKKGKMKKIKTKYADQDEEERQLKLQFLASAGKKNDEEDKKQTKKTEEKPAGGPDLEKRCYKCGLAGHVSANCPTTPLQQKEETHSGSEGESGEDKPEPTQNTDPQPPTTEEKKPSRAEARRKEKQEIQHILEEENISEFDKDDQSGLNELDSLTGNPLPDDVLLFAVPVCAPYSALHNYKYKVKLIPGTMKKGKAVKTAVGIFLHLPNSTQQEKDLIKFVPENEPFQQILGNSKVNTAGLQKQKQQQKKKKKKDAKKREE